jgi:hypothetical protein
MKFHVILHKQIIQQYETTIEAEDEAEAMEKADEYMYANKHSIPWAEGEWELDDDAYNVASVTEEEVA